MRKIGLFTVFAITLLMSACTQDPAQVVYKGAQFYGREHDDTINGPDHITYAENSEKYKPGFAHPAEQAPVPAVGVTDLPPPGAHGQNTNMDNVTVANAPTKPVYGGQQIPSAYSNAPAATTPTVVASDTGAAAPIITGSKFIWPVGAGKVVLHFGPTSDGSANDGINIAAGEGEPIWAVSDGTVVYAGNELKGYGNMVIVRHSGGFMSAYAHERSIAVKKGDTVKQGTLLGYVGSSGGVKTPQLHFVLRKDKTPVNPEQFLPGSLPGNGSMG
jgi:murein DD-endopeptidase MepM/ murein hydrolase activator NlpD